MAGETIVSENNRKLELKDGARSFGFFDFDELKHGTEGGDASVDPNLGHVLRAGRDTTEPFNISRPWEIRREPALARDMLALKNRRTIQAYVWTYDPATRQPVTSEPERALVVMIREVTEPGGKASGGDESTIVVNVEPKPVVVG